MAARKTSVTSSLFLKDTRDVIRRFTEADTNTGVLLSNFQNLGRQHNEGLEVALMVPLGKTRTAELDRQCLPRGQRRRWTESPVQLFQGFSWSTRFFATWTVGVRWAVPGQQLCAGGPSITRREVQRLRDLQLGGEPRPAQRRPLADHDSSEGRLQHERWSYSTTTRTSPKKCGANGKAATST